MHDNSTHENLDVNPEVHYENRDVRFRPLWWFAGAFAMFLVATSIVMAWMFSVLYGYYRSPDRNPPPATVRGMTPPDLSPNANPAATLADLRHQEEQILYGPPRRRPGQDDVVSIPIDRAIELLVERGLQSPPQASDSTDANNSSPENSSPENSSPENNSPENRTPGSDARGSASSRRSVPAGGSQPGGSAAGDGAAGDRAASDEAADADEPAQKDPPQEDPPQEEPPQEEPPQEEPLVPENAGGPASAGERSAGTADASNERGSTQ